MTPTAVALVTVGVLVLVVVAVVVAVIVFRRRAALRTDSQNDPDRSASGETPEVCIDNESEDSGSI
jgi:heme/copper-type cytochrome/quinol oxidase subunit 2